MLPPYHGQDIVSVYSTSCKLFVFVFARKKSVRSKKLVLRFFTSLRNFLLYTHSKSRQKRKNNNYSSTPIHKSSNLPAQYNTVRNETKRNSRKAPYFTTYPSNVAPNCIHFVIVVLISFTENDSIGEYPVDTCGSVGTAWILIERLWSSFNSAQSSVILITFNPNAP